MNASLRYPFRVLLWTFILLLGALPAKAPAQNEVEIESEPVAVRRPFAAFDFPLEIELGRPLYVPRMRQSLALSNDSYSLAHYSLQKLIGEGTFWRSFFAHLAIAGFDVVYSFYPVGNSWLHEEWHRAVFSNRNIGSRNDVYDAKFWPEAIAVSHVKDQNLAELKKEHPAEFVRLMSAGNESSLEQNLALEKSQFFHGTRTWNDALYLFNYLQGQAYIDMCSTLSNNDFTDEFNLEDGANVPMRDFTGCDFSAWTYDLHRPNEPYAARGVHPSGVGIDRYIATRDLSRAEKDFLVRQRKLALLNFVDPNLLGRHYFLLPGENALGNASLRHHLTSFGYTVEANVFYRDQSMKLFGTLRAYRNNERTFPGLEAELIDHPLALGGQDVLLGSRLLLWLQPKDQAFRTQSATPGGMASMRAGLPLSRYVQPYLELQGKTAGWVAGEVSLDASATARIGVTAFAY